MDTSIPSIESIRGRLSGMGYSAVKALAATSGVPFTTLWKIRDGTTGNPGIETVRLFVPHLPQEPDLIGAEGAPAAPTPQATEQGA